MNITRKQLLLFQISFTRHSCLNVTFLCFPGNCIILEKTTSCSQSIPNNLVPFFTNHKFLVADISVMNSTFAPCKPGQCIPKSHLICKAIEISLVLQVLLTCRNPQEMTLTSPLFTFILKKHQPKKFPKSQFLGITANPENTWHPQYSHPTQVTLFFFSQVALDECWEGWISPTTLKRQKSEPFGSFAAVSSLKRCKPQLLVWRWFGNFLFVC